jgi:hypothetical protein
MEIIVEGSYQLQITDPGLNGFPDFMFKKLGSFLGLRLSLRNQ